MKVIYLAGPYSGYSINDVHDHIEEARRVSRKLWMAGYAVVCPHMNTAYMDGEDTWGVFLEGDLEIMARCDIVVMLPGWRGSKGARVEHETAMVLRKRIWYVGEDGQITDRDEMIRNLELPLGGDEG